MTSKTDSAYQVYKRGTRAARIDNLEEFTTNLSMAVDYLQEAAVILVKPPLILQASGIGDIFDMLDRIRTYRDAAAASLSSVKGGK